MIEMCIRDRAKGYFDIKNYEQSVAYYLRKNDEKPLSVVDSYYLGLAYWYLDKDLQADSTFAKILELTPEYAQGWWMRAKIAERMDTAETTLFLAKEHFENYVKFASAAPEKNATTIKNLKWAYNYLAYYWIQQEEKDNVTAKMYYEKILELDPADPDAIDKLKLLNQR